MASGRDECGNPIYIRYNENYAGEISTGRNAYGNPIYEWFYLGLIFI